MHTGQKAQYLTPEQATDQLLHGWDAGTLRNGADVLQLLDFGADINAVDANGMTPLIHAARAADNVECITTLIRAGASVSARDNTGRTALIAALAANKTENVRALVDAGANTNIKLEEYSMATPLMLACMHCNIDIVKILLGAYAAVNARDASGYTALMIAIEANKPDLVNLLLDNGANVDTRVKDFAETCPDFVKTKAYTRLIQIS